MKFPTLKLPIKSRYFLIASLGIVAVFIGILLALKENRIPKPTISPPVIQPPIPNISKISLTQINLSGGFSFPSLPKNLSVYQAIAAETDPFLFAQKLAQTMELTADQNISNLWVDLSRQKFITLDKANNQVAYRIDLNQDQNKLAGTIQGKTDSLISIAESFVKDKLSFNNLTPEKSKIRYFFAVAGGESTLASENNGNLMEVSFSPVINGIPIKYSNIVQPPVVITVNSAGEIIRAAISPQTVSGDTKVGDYPTIPQEIIKKLILENKGALLSAVKQDLSESPVEQLSAITLNSADLEYRFIPQQNLLIPYLNFSGDGTLPDGTKVKIIYLLPALAPAIFISP